MENFFNNFTIEPRSDFYTEEEWLVLYDKRAKIYVKEPGNKKKYMRFKNSEEIIKFFGLQEDDNN